jgi:hypothetical protein
MPQDKEDLAALKAEPVASEYEPRQHLTSLDLFRKRMAAAPSARVGQLVIATYAEIKGALVGWREVRPVFDLWPRVC